MRQNPLIWVVIILAVAACFYLLRNGPPELVEETIAEGPFEGVALTPVNWEEQVDKSPLPVMVDFWAPWCGPCRKLAPTIAALSRENVGKLRVGKLNTDGVGAEAISARFQVEGLPTVVFFVGGKEVERLVGIHPKADYDKVLKSLAQSAH